MRITLTNSLAYVDDYCLYGLFVEENIYNGHEDHVEYETHSI